MTRKRRKKQQSYKGIGILLIPVLIVLLSFPVYAEEIVSDPDAVTESETISDDEAEKEKEEQEEKEEEEEKASPNVQIKIIKPTGWWNKNNAKVKVEVEDLANTGNFTIASVKGAAGSGSSYVDITSEMYVEISENVTVYVQVTDSEGNKYSASKYIDCYDKTKPTLNAAVNNGLLTVQATDTDSGVKAVYVNQYEFTDMVNGVISIRMKKYDANYEYFTVQALDNAGNMSEVYKVQNPYYKNKNKQNNSTSSNKTSNSSSSGKTEKNPVETLPASVTPTPVLETPSADVVEHVKTDEDGEVVKQEHESDKGKEFYVINTKNGKEFYLVIDRTGDEEKTYFLTGITDNDLLNVTGVTADELPENAAYDSTDYPYIVGLPNNSSGLESEAKEQTAESGGIFEGVSLDLPDDSTAESTENSTESTEETEENEKEGIPPLTWFGFVALAILGVGYFLLNRKKKKNLAEEDVDDEEYLDEESGDEDEELESETDNEEELYYPEPEEKIKEEEPADNLQKEPTEPEPEETIPESSEDEDFPDDFGEDNEENEDPSADLYKDSVVEKLMNNEVSEDDIEAMEDMSRKEEEIDEK